MSERDYNEGGYGFTSDERRSLGEKLEAERDELRSLVQQLGDAHAAVVAALVPGDFKASGEWEIYQKLARIHIEISSAALSAYRAHQEESER